MFDESKSYCPFSSFLFPQEKIWREKDKSKYKSGCIKSVYDLSLYPLATVKASK